MPDEHQRPAVPAHHPSHADRTPSTIAARRTIPSVTQPAAQALHAASKAFGLVIQSDRDEADSGTVSRHPVPQPGPPFLNQGATAPRAPGRATRPRPPAVAPAALARAHAVFEPIGDGEVPGRAEGGDDRPQDCRYLERAALRGHRGRPRRTGPEGSAAAT
jgi:hypothetical protein